MIAERLRKSILQAAVQGKLTEQLPEDGDARDLLKEIQKGKAQLVKDGKIKKEKPLPEITEEEIPFDIPDNWCWVRLGDVAINITDGTHSTPKYQTSGIPFLSVKDISSGYMDFSNTKYVSQETHDELRKRCCPQRNDLLITKVGTTGIPVIVDTDMEFSLFVSVALIKYSIEYTSPEYLKLIINSPFVQQQVEDNTRGVGNKNWVIRDISKTLIVLPPMKEQRRIVESISHVMAKIDSLRMDETRLKSVQKSFPKKMKDSLLQSAIQGKLTEQLESDGDAHELVAEIQKEKARLIKEGAIKKEKPLPEITEDEIPFDIPENWCWVRLGEVTDYGVGKQVNSSNISPNSWILELEDIEKESFTLNIKRKDRVPGSSKNRFLKADVLYGKLRPYLKKVIIANEDGYCSTEIIPFRGHFGIHSDYLKYCIVAPSVDGYINQITHGMDMPRLRTDKGRALVIPLPPTAEQQRIVQRLDQFMSLCDELE